VADRLEDLPSVSSALESGEVSFDQIQALSRFATSKDDADLAASAPEMSVAQLRRQGRRAETIDTADVQRAHSQRWLKWWWSEPERMFHFSGRVPDHEGAVVAKALHRIALYTRRPIQKPVASKTTKRAAPRRWYRWPPSPWAKMPIRTDPVL
jgi:hypothetical protein